MSYVVLYFKTLFDVDCFIFDQSFQKFHKIQGIQAHTRALEIQDMVWNTKLQKVIISLISPLT